MLEAGTACDMLKKQPDSPRHPLKHALRLLLLTETRKAQTHDF